MVSINPIGVAVPFFFALLGIEILVARRKHRTLHRLNDSMSDLTCGMGDQLIGVFTKAIPLGIYALVESHFGLLELTTASPWLWIAAMLLVDHQYYWYHRFSHRVNLGWATHVVHHQSEEYNLAVALRQPWFTQSYNWVFYLPLALLGIPTIVWATCYALNLLYQFWIHTRLIDRLGPLEWFLNTPSHHRVHHGVNDEYLDRNYAGILIVWDRLYGTFQAEQAEVLYGTRRPLRSWNPLWANVEPLVHVARLSAASKGLSEKLYALIAPPEWTPRAAEDLTKDDFMQQRAYDRDVSQVLHPYVMLHLLPVGTLMAWMLTFDQTLSTPILATGSLAIAWAGIGWTGLFEGKSWALGSEIARHLAMVCALIGLGVAGFNLVLIAPVAVLTLISLFWLLQKKTVLQHS